MRKELDNALTAVNALIYAISQEENQLKERLLNVIRKEEELKNRENKLVVLQTDHLADSELLGRREADIYRKENELKEREDKLKKSEAELESVETKKGELQKLQAALDKKINMSEDLERREEELAYKEEELKKQRVVDRERKLKLDDREAAINVLQNRVERVASSIGS